MASRTESRSDAPSVRWSLRLAAPRAADRATQVRATGQLHSSSNVEHLNVAFPASFAALLNPREAVEEHWLRLWQTGCRAPASPDKGIPGRNTVVAHIYPPNG